MKDVLHPTSRAHRIEHRYVQRSPITWMFAALWFPKSRHLVYSSFLSPSSVPTSCKLTPMTQRPKSYISLIPTRPISKCRLSDVSPHISTKRLVSTLPTRGLEGYPWLCLDSMSGSCQSLSAQQTTTSLPNTAPTLAVCGKEMSWQGLNFPP